MEYVEGAEEVSKGLPHRQGILNSDLPHLCETVEFPGMPVIPALWTQTCALELWPGSLAIPLSSRFK